MKAFFKAFMVIFIEIVEYIVFDVFGRFYRLDFRRKMAFFLFIGLFLVTLWLLVGTLTGGWLIRGLHYSRFPSLEVSADKVYDFNLKEVLRFDALFPPQTFSILIEKIIVNLKPAGIHTNPMGVFQIYLEVDSKKTAIQIRSIRQKVSDRIQREIEGLTYDAITKDPGKENLKEVIQESVNEILTQGLVQKVYFKKIIIKP